MADSRKKNKKIIKYRRPLNIGVVFFGFIAVYLIVCVYMFFTSTHISGYEVIAGNLATDYHYTGIVLRTEQVFQSEKPGYVSYYAREGEKVSVNSAVYTVDESGKMAQAMKNNVQELNLSGEDYDQLRGEIITYMSNVSDMNFSEVYDFKADMDVAILDHMNQNMIEQLDSAAEDGGEIFSRYNAGAAGVVEYYIDGFEDASLESLTGAWFEQEAYERTNLRTEDLVGQGEPVYKLITEELWRIVFPMDEDMENYLLDKIKGNQTTKEDGTVVQNKTYIDIRMDKDKEILTPSVTVEYREGKAYGVLEFVNSMIRYANERFLTFEILRDETEGLKIPKSAVTEKEFFVIDKAYITNSGADSNMGFMKQTVGEDGSTDAKFVNCTIYYQDDQFAYVDPKEENFSTSEKLLSAGDLLIRTDSAEVYPVGQLESLKGVYNINKGYTIFRQIQILYENEEYCIVKEGTSYGLSVYDHIVLNAETVDEDEVIYD